VKKIQTMISRNEKIRLISGFESNFWHSQIASSKYSWTICTRIVGEHRPSTHASASCTIVRVRVCASYTRSHTKSHRYSQALDYSYAIHQPAFMVKACVLTASNCVHVCCMCAWTHAWSMISRVWYIRIRRWLPNFDTDRYWRQMRACTTTNRFFSIS